MEPHLPSSFEDSAGEQIIVGKYCCGAINTAQEVDPGLDCVVEAVGNIAYLGGSRQSRGIAFQLEEGLGGVVVLLAVPNEGKTLVATAEKVLGDDAPAPVG